MASKQTCWLARAVVVGTAGLAAFGCGRQGFVTADAAAHLDASADAPTALDAPFSDAASPNDAGPAADVLASMDVGTDARGLDAASAPDARADLLCGGRLGAANPFTIPSACSAVFAASAYCGTIAGGRVRYVDLDTGAVCDGPTVRGADLFGNAAIGWAGDAMYACNGSRIVRISLRDGAVIDLGTPCEAVTTDDGASLLVLADTSAGDLLVYGTEGDAMSGRPARTVAVSYAASRIGARGDSAVLSWHSTDRVALVDLAAAVPAPTDLVLAGYDDWIHGVDVLASGDVAVGEIDRTLGADVIAILDPLTGPVRTVRPSLAGDLGGLACFSGPPPAPLAMGVFSHETAPPASGACSAIASYADTMDNRHPPSAATSATCTMGQPSSYLGFCDLLDPADPELHVISVYQGSGGVIDVTVRARPRPVVLALTSYEPIEWRVTLEPGATIDRVLVSDFPGGAASSVTGLPLGVTAEVIEACGYGYGWEPLHNTGGGDLRSTISALRGLTGLAETTFQGCYEGSAFVVPF